MTIREYRIPIRINWGEYRTPIYIFRDELLAEHRERMIMRDVAMCQFMMVAYCHLMRDACFAWNEL